MHQFIALVPCVAVIACLAAFGAENNLVPAELCKPRSGLGNVLAKLDRGGEVGIAYFGGSITAAAGWRVKTLEWFRRNWRKAEVSEIHAAIGGTGSDLGAFRCGRDVVEKRPDLVFVEFSVNDGHASPESIHATMEGLVRQIWRADPMTDICFVYTYRVGYEAELERGLCPRAASADERVAEHYGIASINPALRVIELHREGKLLYKVDREDKPPAGKIAFSSDGVHPRDAGHEVYLDVIASAIASMRRSSRPGPHRLGNPLTPDNFEDARLVEVDRSMLEGTWQRLDGSSGLGKRFAGRLPAIWHAATPGDTMRFHFEGTFCKLYDLLGPDGGKALVRVDGGQAAKRDRFDRYCSYHRLASLHVASGLPGGVHEVEIALSPEQPDREPVISRERDKPGFDPERYDGTNLWVGYIMLRGNLVD